MSATLMPNRAPTPLPGTIEAVGDPLAIVKEVITLRRLVGLYPAEHPLIADKLRELDVALARRFEQRPSLQVDIVRGDVHLDGDAFRQESRPMPTSSRS